MYQEVMNGGGGSERCDYGETPVWTSAWQEIDLGYEPDYVIMTYLDSSNSASFIMSKDKTISNNTVLGFTYGGKATLAYCDRDLVNDETHYKITDKGFAFRDESFYLGKTLRYYAMKK